MFPPSLFVTSPFSAFIITFPSAVMSEPFIFIWYVLSISCFGCSFLSLLFLRKFVTAVPSVPVAFNVSFIITSVSPIFSKCPFLTSPYTSPLACSFPLSFLINVSAISARFPSDSIFPLLFSIIPASTYVSSFPFISPVSVFNTFPPAFIYRFLSLKRFPLFSILSAFNTRVVVPFISFALSRFPFVSMLSILDTMFSFNITPCSAINSSVFFLSIFSFTVIFFAFNVVA